MLIQNKYILYRRMSENKFQIYSNQRRALPKLLSDCTVNAHTKTVCLYAPQQSPLLVIFTLATMVGPSRATAHQGSLSHWVSVHLQCTSFI